eukprot:CAMPEP_0172649930 /NCGR_PEP_ID=MMETSP1068-20121228/242039_1 /TAXON_ID=35684 /ORGANISM="Pseudopedinella elastica, Strain CCMP716" /LENGTH=292 /DNA_ID=CAMNT_0013464291 /DNA_START=137 /DNA_END=1015 /DNA_ORIENTATION=-
MGVYKVRDLDPLGFPLGRGQSHRPNCMFEGSPTLRLRASCHLQPRRRRRRCAREPAAPGANPAISSGAALLVAALLVASSCGPAALVLFGVEGEVEGEPPQFGHKILARGAVRVGPHQNLGSALGGLEGASRNAACELWVVQKVRSDHQVTSGERKLAHVGANVKMLRGQLGQREDDIPTQRHIYFFRPSRRFDSEVWGGRMRKGRRRRRRSRRKRRKRGSLSDRDRELLVLSRRLDEPERLRGDVGGDHLPAPQPGRGQAAQAVPGAQLENPAGEAALPLFRYCFQSPCAP